MASVAQVARRETGGWTSARSVAADEASKLARTAEKPLPPTSSSLLAAITFWWWPLAEVSDALPSNFLPRLKRVHDGGRSTGWKTHTKPDVVTCGYCGFGKIAPDRLMAKGAIYSRSQETS